MAADIVESEEGSQEIPDEPHVPEEKPEPLRELLSDALREDLSHPVFGKEFKPTLFLELRSAADVKSRLEEDSNAPETNERSKLDMILLSPEGDFRISHPFFFSVYLHPISELLARRGRIYLLLSADDNPVELCHYLGKKGLLSREVISEQCGHGKTLSLFCFTRKS